MNIVKTFELKPNTNNVKSLEDGQYKSQTNYRNCNFPKLCVSLVQKLDAPFEDLTFNQILKNSNFVLGGSYNIYSHLPYYNERCAIFESLHFPYNNLDIKYFKVRNSILLWPLIQTCSYTSIMDPQRVLITKHNKIVGELRFMLSGIYLYELYDSKYNYFNKNLKINF